MRRTPGCYPPGWGRRVVPLLLCGLTLLNQMLCPRRLIHNCALWHLYRTRARGRTGGIPAAPAFGLGRSKWKLVPPPSRSVAHLLRKASTCQAGEQPSFHLHLPSALVWRWHKQGCLILSTQPGQPGTAPCTALPRLAESLHNPPLPPIA